MSDLTSDDLIALLDKRLEEQGLNLRAMSVKIIVDYLRDGWGVIALPPELADQMDGTMATGETLPVLAGELRRCLMEAEEPRNEPPYPAELLDELANALAWWSINKQPFSSSERVLQALDRYTKEVGRENVGPEVAKAIAELI